ncbi:MAG TPA: hypothetical protein VN922_14655 [Bacteroidia bacterium]|nr:hypothetical protein [Bacteroidia bacterium]
MYTGNEEPFPREFGLDKTKRNERLAAFPRAKRYYWAKALQSFGEVIEDVHGNSFFKCDAFFLIGSRCMGPNL